MWRPRLALLGALVAVLLLAPAAAGAGDGGSVQPRIVGGSDASISQYPWQAALVVSPDKRGGNAHDRQFCGGSLLTSRIVITAGHCLWGYDPDCFLPCSQNHLEADDLNVVLGHATLSTVPESDETRVDAVKIQANYDNDYQGDGVPRYDAAYLVLSSASTQKQIKIAATDEGALWDAGSPADISGWGSTKACIISCGSTVDTLRAARVAVIADSICGSSSVYGSDFDPATMVCAGYLDGGVDSCAGDSGGPLEAPLPAGGYRLVGITGWGEGCAQADAPGVYTRISGPTMRTLIQGDVSGLESTYGLPAEAIFGGGGAAPAAAATPAPPPAPATAAVEVSSKTRHPFRKCKRIHGKNKKAQKRKRRRCFKKVRSKLEHRR